MRADSGTEAALAAMGVRRRKRAWPLPSLVRQLGLGGLVALGFLCALTLAVLLGPIAWSVDPFETDLSRRLLGPSASHPLGTDQFGRDQLARLLHGGRISLLGAVAVLAANTVIGLVYGAVAGYLRGPAEAALSRALDVFLALPALVVAIALTGAFGRSLPNLLFALIVSSWPWFARIYRGLVRSESQREYVTAALALGCPPGRILWRHIGPNIASPAIVLTTVSFGSAILGLTSLSFLGLGPQPPSPEWGAMINGARYLFQTHPLLIALPGLAIGVAVLAVNILGDAARDALDPRFRA